MGFSKELRGFNDLAFKHPDKSNTAIGIRATGALVSWLKMIWVNCAIRIKPSRECKANSHGASLSRENLNALN